MIRVSNRRIDAYGFRVNKNRTKHEDCICVVPCKTFMCRCPDHVGNRRSPWCCGSDADDIDTRGSWCATCWNRVRVALEEQR